MQKTFVMAKHALIATTAALAVGCAATDPIPSRGEAELVWTSHDERPGWMNEPNTSFDEDETWSFVGRSVRHATERSAIEAARRYAMIKAVKGIRSHVDVDDRTRITGDSAEDQIQNQQLSIDKGRIVTAHGEIGPIRASETYLRAYDSSDGRYYTAAVQLRVPPDARQAYEATFEAPQTDDGSANKPPESGGEGNNNTPASRDGSRSAKPDNGALQASEIQQGHRDAQANAQLREALEF